MDRFAAVRARFTDADWDEVQSLAEWLASVGYMPGSMKFHKLVCYIYIRRMRRHNVRFTLEGQC